VIVIGEEFRMPTPTDGNVQLTGRKADFLSPIRNGKGWVTGYRNLHEQDLFIRTSFTVLSDSKITGEKHQSDLVIGLFWTRGEIVGSYKFFRMLASRTGVEPVSPP